jgi:hypothetical protein
LGLRALAFSFLLLAAALPTVGATNICQSAGPAYACAGDFETGCSSSTGANLFVGSLSPLATANVNGAAHRCSPGEAVTASAWVSGQSVALRWWDGATCYHEVRAAGNGQQVACPAGGPPNPGWGSVLP